jgi:hypothetical protein
MNEVAAVVKATLALVLVGAGLWHLFGLGRWLASGGGSRQLRSRREKGKDDPLKKASLDPR